MRIDITLNWERPLIDKEIQIYYYRDAGEIDTDSIEIYRGGCDYTKAFERLSDIHGSLWGELKEAIRDNESPLFEVLSESFELNY